MTRVQAVEQALSSMNPAKFQELGDCFLSRKPHNIFSKIGNMVGKEKTIKGTPDTLLQAPNGKYTFIQYSTDVTSGITKIKDDIEKCLNEKRTHIPAAEIEEIIIFINFNLDTKETRTLAGSLESTGIKLTIYTNSGFALELLDNRHDLIARYLDLHFNSGQIVSIDTFIEEYNKASSGIATPLDNDFLHRDQEIQEFIKSLESHDFIIFTGSPGAGKTRLALEGIKQFLQTNLSFSAYCISYKSTCLIEDLEQYLDKNKNYILFIDDANRVDSFGQIIGFYTTIRGGQLKIICTVRDYAFDEISKLCTEYSLKRIDIKKLSDKQLIDIIKANPFEILNSEYYKIILNIADGNPRLAIMAAKLAKAKQNIYALSDVSELFDCYFKTYIKDKKEFEDTFNIKCLAVIAFFLAIPYSDKNTTCSILNKFNLNYSRFIDCIDTFEKMEIVERQYGFVRITEQNFGIYLFFKAFIRDRLLSFYTLLKNYSKTKLSRFKDCIVSSNNMFGFDVVLENLSPDLRKYFSLIENDFDRCYDFLFIFWPYLDKETFDCLYKYINSLPIEHNPVFEISAVNNIYTTDRILDILNVIFHYPRFIKEALELAMEYIKRKPNKISYLVGSIKSSIVYRKEDEQSGFARQAALFDIILKHAPLNCVLFFGISGFFLSEKFHVTENGRNSTILYYIYTLPFNPHVKDIRNKIWNFIGSIFDLFPEDCFNLLEAYSADRIRDNKELVELDMSFIIKIINSRLDKKSLIHCAYVHQQIKNWKVQGINIPEFDNILDSFSNKYYDLYINLKIDYFHDDFIYQTVEQFDALKRDILRMNFIFHNTRGVDEFLENYFYVYKYAKDNRNLNSSLEIIIDENCVIDFYLGCLILIKIIEKNNDIGYIPSSIIVKYFSTSEKSRYLWQIIESRDFLGKSLWKLYYFYNMNQNIIYNDHINDLVMTINNLEGNIDLYLKPLEKYQKFRPDLFPVLLHSIVKLNEHGNKITLIPEESILCIDIPSNIEIIKQFYFQEKDADSNYDYDKTILVEIIKSDKSFLYDYAERYYINNPNHNSISVNMLGLVWQIPQIEDIFTRILNGMTKDAQDYSFSEDTLNNFFSFPQENTFKFRAKYFLFEYSRKNKKDSVKINLVVDIILHSMREFFNEYLLFFLDMNHDAKFFSKIYWRGRDTFARGDVILEEIDASDWKNILSIIEKSTLGIKLIPIRRYVNDMIENYTISINKRRKERFLYLY